MINTINTLTYNGIEVVDITVEIRVSQGTPNFTIIGLVDNVAAELIKKLSASLESIGLTLPTKQVVISLTPSHITKADLHFALPIACALLVNLGVISPKLINNYLVIGELSNGNTKPVNGILPAAVSANNRNKGLVCPKKNQTEALWSGNKNIVAVDNLLELINYFRQDSYKLAPKEYNVQSTDFDMANFNVVDINGMEFAKRATEIAAAGGHNLLMSGAPSGTAKLMLASRLSSIMPPLSNKEMIENGMIYSVAGLMTNDKLAWQRPYRIPHYSSSVEAIIGSDLGYKINPGEISLANNGILFLDELPEFRQEVMQALIMPLKNKNILIATANKHVTLPAKFQLVAAMNPCRCGYLDNDSRNCAKAPQCGINYQLKVSEAIMEHIDITIDVEALSPIMVSNKQSSHDDIRASVINARAIQETRFKDFIFKTNAAMPFECFGTFAMLASDATLLLARVIDKLKLSTLSYRRIIRVARTLADLDESNKIHKQHIAEAVHYRKINYQKHQLQGLS